MRPTIKPFLSFNIVLSLLGLPWCHLALPHSDLHVRNLAHIDEKVVGGIVRETICSGTVLEQRVTAFMGHILIGLCLIPAIFKQIIINIPMPIFDGVFMFLAVTSLYDNQVLERFMLLFTESEAYQGTTYLRKVPKRNIHIMTFFRWFGV